MSALTTAARLFRVGPSRHVYKRNNRIHIGGNLTSAAPRMEKVRPTKGITEYGIVLVGGLLTSMFTKEYLKQYLY